MGVGATRDSAPETVQDTTLSVRISLDAMGGDYGPAVTVSAARHTLKKHPELRLWLVGDQDRIQEQLGDTVDERVQVVHASEHIAMDESPAVALRSKKDSSMRVAINLVKNGQVDACVSAGNTGALMAIARFVLRMLPGVDRPAICSALPGVGADTHVLDLGANVDSSSEQLFQFAVMGSVLTSAILNVERPTVGLLNIGEEEIKGNDRVKQAAALLMQSDLNYIGFVEGSDIYHGKADVIVCDGFVGNVALKASEGVANMLTQFAREEFSQGPYSKLAAAMALPVLKRLKRRIDPRRYNGASLLGLRGIVVKSHGGADELSFAYAIEEAMLEVEKNVPEHTASHLESLLVEKVET